MWINWVKLKFFKVKLADILNKISKIFWKLYKKKKKNSVCSGTHDRSETSDLAG